MEIIRHRSGLKRLIKAIECGSVTLGFIGGSITDQSSGKMWPEYVTAWFIENYPDVRFIIENAAIGATGSELAVFRAERDLVNRKCDVVFVEFAVNDNDQTAEKRMRTREGLVRKLLKAEMDVVIVYTFCQQMYDDMINGRMPASIGEFEELACHYGIGSVWMGLNALEELKKGRMKWEEWLPDGLHPEYRGSCSYAASVIEYLENELNSGSDAMRSAFENIPEPINRLNWENTAIIPFTDVNTKGPWALRRWSRMPWADQVLDTSAVGSGLSFRFMGRGLSLGFDFGRFSSEFRYRMDDGDWISVVRERLWWCPDYGWYRITTISDSLQYGDHQFELEVIHGNRDECKGSNFRLAFIGVIK